MFSILFYNSILVYISLLKKYNILVYVVGRLIKQIWLSLLYTNIIDRKKSEKKMHLFFFSSIKIQ